MAAKPRECRARVIAVRSPAPDVLEADLDMVDPPALEFEAGQWVSVPFGPKTVRAYSIASPSTVRTRITLCADVVPGGMGSRWFRDLRPGAPVAFKGPLGGFVWAAAEPRRPLFVAEEIGIVPIRSILASLEARGLDRPARLIQWAREPAGLVYAAEFESLAANVSGFAYDPVVRSAGAAWTGLRGEAVDTVERLVTDVTGLVAYVAGSQATIHRVRDLLVARGLDRKAVKWEKFW
ncbi:MAG: FAD-binding oxidoreductase [Candidatus Rokuibacteriota bacterium]